MNRKILSSTLVVVSLIAAIGGSAFALFRDTEYIPGNTISTGAVDIDLSGESAQFPSPINAENLMPGEWSDWSKVKVTNKSTTDVSLYFYVTNVEGAACDATNLDFKADGHDESLFNSNILAVKGVNNKVRVSDPSLAADGVAVYGIRAGLSEDAGSDVMGKSCHWTGVFLAEPAIPEVPISTPVSMPTSFPEAL